MRKMLFFRKKSFFLTFLIITAAILAGVGISFSQKQNVVSRLNFGSSFPEAFLSIDDPNLVEYGSYYSFKTVAGELVQTEDGPRLLVELENEKLPNIIIGNKTLIYFLAADGKSARASINDLVPGQEILIILTNNYKDSTWVARNISILVNTLPKIRLTPVGGAEK